MGRGEGAKPYVYKGVRTISFLEEVKQQALNTQIDAKKIEKTNNFPSIENFDCETIKIENECSIDEIAPIDLKSKKKTAKKNFVIKSDTLTKKNAKKTSEPKFK